MTSSLGINRAKNEAIHYALAMGKRPKFAIGGAPMTTSFMPRATPVMGRQALALGGGPAITPLQGVNDSPVTGPLLGTDGGRTDTLPISVPSGSFVIPADVVSGIPGAEGNSLAGHSALTKLFGQKQPFSPDSAPYGAPSPNLVRGRTIPGLMSQHRMQAQAFDQAGHPSLAKGGHVTEKEDAHSHAIPIMAAGGEFVVHPEAVRRIGLGSLKRGHEILDKWVDQVRAENIKTLKKLPGTVKK